MKEDYAQLKARYERLKLLYQVGGVIHSTLEPQPALNLIVREAARLMDASSCSVILLNPTNGLLEIQASQGLPEKAEALRLRIGEGLTGWVAQTGKPARVGDVREDKRYIMLRPEVRSELAVPLEVNNEVRGVLNVDADRLDAFTEDDQELLESLAAQVASVIQNTWLYEQLRLKARLLESLASVSRTINSALNLDEVLQIITREASELMQAKMCSLMMLDETRSWLDLRASFGASASYIGKPRLSAHESLIGAVVRRKRPIHVENVQTSMRFQNVEVARQEGLFSLLSAPLMFAGESIGVLNVYTGKPYHYSDEEIRILAAFAELSAIAIEKARLYERVVDVEEQLRQNEKLSALGLLAAEVAHEIRNPLTVMKMLYHSLDLKFPGKDPRNRDAQLLGEKIEHLNKIVERILDFARTTEPQLLLVDLNELVEELSLLVRHKLANQGVILVCTLQPNLPAVMGDAMQLEQAFLNLILNATEAMPEGGKLTITTRAEEGPGTNPSGVTVIFTDDGEGMSEEQCARAFSSVLSTTKAKGTGLGLAIVGRTVETHGGTVTIQSRIGQGTTFEITIPVQERGKLDGTGREN